MLIRLSKLEGVIQTEGTEIESRYELLTTRKCAAIFNMDESNFLKLIKQVVIDDKGLMDTKLDFTKVSVFPGMESSEDLMDNGGIGIKSLLFIVRNEKFEALLAERIDFLKRKKAKAAGKVRGRGRPKGSKAKKRV